LPEEQKPEDLLKLQFAKRTYIFNVARRFANVRRYNVLKRQQEVKENPYFKQIRSFVYKLIGRKEEGAQ